MLTFLDIRFIAIFTKAKAYHSHVLYSLGWSKC